MISKFRIGVLVIILNFFASVAMIWGQDNPSLLQMAVPSLNIAPDTRILDPEKKEEANVGLQLSYVAQTTQVITGGYWGGWWDYGFWGPWSGWYYPYPVSYSYNTNTLVMEMVDLTADEDGTQKNLPVVWYASASGFQYSGQFNQMMLQNSVVQAFEQSPYIKSVN